MHGTDLRPCLAIQSQNHARFTYRGGNAFDAIVAFASLVVEPARCGVGGCARLAGPAAREGRLVPVEGYLRTPDEAREDMFEVDDTRGPKCCETPWTKGFKADKRHLAASVPIPVAALRKVHRRRGRLDRARVLGPSIRLAESGLAMT